MFDVPDWNLSSPIPEAVDDKKKAKQQKPHPKGRLDSVSNSEPYQKKRPQQRQDRGSDQQRKKQQRPDEKNRFKNENERRPDKRIIEKKVERQISVTSEEKSIPVVNQPVAASIQEGIKQSSTLLRKLDKDAVSSKFRWINEKLYTSKSEQAVELFKDEPELFHLYHEGFRNQVTKWPVHPLHLIKKHLTDKVSKLKARKLVVADMGCGEAELGKSLITGHPRSFQVHSFDLVASSPLVTVSDIANVPLPDASVDVCVFCLSLMGTNFNDFLAEANRILKPGGELIIAEVESRITSMKTFTSWIQSHSFRPVKMPESAQAKLYFVLQKYIKTGSSSRETCAFKAHEILKPCLYKKR